MPQSNGKNKLLVPGVEESLNKMKLEIAQEFGFVDYDQIDKGNLSAQQNGAIGGEMTKRLIRMGQEALANKG